MSKASTGTLEVEMKLPIRNRTSRPLTLFIEPYCDEHEIPPDGEAIVTLADGEPHSLDIHPENWVSLWDEGKCPGVVEVVSKEQNAVVDALAFVRGWLRHFGPEGKAAATEIDDAVAHAEDSSGYVGARLATYSAFRDGYRLKQAQAEPTGAALPKWSGREPLAGAYRAGGIAALFNHRVRRQPSLIELGEPPFDTDVARRKFAEADALVDESGA